MSLACCLAACILFTAVCLGLWVCMDPNCTASEQVATRPVGRMFAQPRDLCDCGLRVPELYTCRSCGTAYARAYTDDVQVPTFLWGEAGLNCQIYKRKRKKRSLSPFTCCWRSRFSALSSQLTMILATGRLNPKNPSPRVRTVFLRKDRSIPYKDDADQSAKADSKPGEFKPCAVCGQTASFGRSSVQDHQTKGDQPFQALITKQLQIQPPNNVPPTGLAPLRGRKVLIFSDSRQTAARLAPNLQKYSTQDALRPLICVGYQVLQQQTSIRKLLSLQDLYLAVLISSKQLGVRLRPELRAGEDFIEDVTVEQALKQGALADSERMLELFTEVGRSTPPESLLSAIIDTLFHRYYGMEALALASIIERDKFSEKILGLPPIPEVAESAEQKMAIARIWLRQWQKNGFLLNGMPKHGGRPDQYLTPGPGCERCYQRKQPGPSSTGIGCLSCVNGFAIRSPEAGSG